MADTLTLNRPIISFNLSEGSGNIQDDECKSLCSLILKCNALLKKRPDLAKNLTIRVDGTLKGGAAKGPTPEERETHDYSYYPINYPRLDQKYQDLKNIYWTAQEIDYTYDYDDWMKLDKPTRLFIGNNVLLFSEADGVVNENLIENFKKRTSNIKEASHFYAAQEFNEVGHKETYGNFVVTFFPEPAERTKAFSAIKNYPCVNKMAQWMFKWMDGSIPLMQQIIAFICVEGIFFSSAFASIYWIKRRNILPGLCKANEFIARDEAIHTEFGIELYHTYTKIRKEYDVLEQHIVHNIIKSAVNTAEKFTREILQVDLVGMNANDMIDYVKCTADELSVKLGYEKPYNITNPFDWMAIIGLPNKTNFHETRPTEYGRQSTADFSFDLDVEF